MTLSDLSDFTFDAYGPRILSTFVYYDRLKFYKIFVYVHKIKGSESTCIGGKLDMKKPLEIRKPIFDLSLIASSLSCETTSFCFKDKI